MVKAIGADSHADVLAGRAQEAPATARSFKARSSHIDARPDRWFNNIMHRDHDAGSARRADIVAKRGIAAE